MSPLSARTRKEFQDIEIRSFVKTTNFTHLRVPELDATQNSGPDTRNILFSIFSTTSPFFGGGEGSFFDWAGVLTTIYPVMSSKTKSLGNNFTRIQLKRPHQNDLVFPLQSAQIRTSIKTLYFFFVWKEMSQELFLGTFLEGTVPGIVFPYSWNYWEYNSQELFGNLFLGTFPVHWEL